MCVRPSPARATLSVEASDSLCGLWHSECGAVTINRTAFDGLLYYLRFVSALRVDTRASSIIVHVECGPCNVRTICASYAGRLVHVHEAHLQGLAILVQVELHVRRCILVLFNDRPIGLPKQRIHEPLVGFCIRLCLGLHRESAMAGKERLSAAQLRCRRAEQPRQQWDAHGACGAAASGGCIVGESLHCVMREQQDG